MSGVDDLRLIAPDRRLKSEFLRMAEEFEAEGSARWAEAREDFESYFVRHEGCLDRNRLPRGAVPWTAYCITCQELADRNREENLEMFEELMVA